MSSLELKVPPAVLTLVFAVLMWLGAKVTPGLSVGWSARAMVSLFLAAAGIALIIGAGVLFRRSGTTVNPATPSNTSQLVTSGIYRFTRNPMYLGMLLILVAIAVALGNLVALALTGCFVLYMNRFQIGPEERALSPLLGPPYDEYLRRVRRWL